MRLELDTSSEIGFKVADFNGVFKDFNGEAHIDDGITNIILNINPKSIYTGDIYRDSLFKSEFFNYNNMTFIVNEYVNFEELKSLTGYLTIKGVTNEMKLDVEYLGKKMQLSGNEKFDFSINGEIDGKNQIWNEFLKVDDIITINCEIQFVKENN